MGKFWTKKEINLLAFYSLIYRVCFSACLPSHFMYVHVAIGPVLGEIKSVEATYEFLK